MRKLILLAAAVTTLAGSAFAVGKNANDRLVVFPTQAKVEIDSNGNVTAVTPDPSLSPAIGQAIQADVKQWRFVAPTKADHPVGGVTFVQVDACAAPKDGKYLFVVKYRGNGPGHAGPLVPPQYPSEAMRFGVSANLQITYRILPDGSAQVEDIAFLEGGKRFDKSFRATAKKWLENSRFYPERVDGAPVSTRESITVTFSAGIDPRYKQAVTARLTACQAALDARDGDDRQVALDSPFQLIPAN